MRTYTEEEIRAVWAAVMTCSGETPSTDFQRRFFQLLPQTKGKAMLFTRDEMLAVATTRHEKVIVHGIFAVMDTAMANEGVLMAHAREANLGGNMEILIRLAKARKEEGFQPGDVVRDANGRWYRRRKDGGTHPWEQFGTVAVTPDEWLKRPLEKM